MKKLLVVVDMINGFAVEGVLADPKINKITPYIIKRIENAIKTGTPIVGFRDAHDLGDEEFEHFPVHCIKGTYESQYVEELQKYAPYMIDIEKDTTNGFITNKFQRIIKNNDFDEVEVVGCCTDICVLNFVTSLQKHIKDNMLETKIIVQPRGVATFDNPNHNAQIYQRNALQSMRKMGVQVEANNYTHIM